MFDYREIAKYSVERGLPRLLDTKYDPSRPMGNVAMSNLVDVFSAWLAGFATDFSPTIPRSIEWIDLALERGESIGEHKHFYYADLLRAKALGVWATENIGASEIWEAARVYDEQQQTVFAGWPTKQMPTKYLDDYLALCYQAEAYEAGIAAYEKYHGVKKLALKKIHYPRDFGYALCLHKARNDFDGEDFLAAGRKVLTANLEKEWLGRGQYLRAVMWLKIVYWNLVPGSTPLLSVLRAYDDMPNSPRPDFLD